MQRHSLGLHRTGPSFGCPAMISGVAFSVCGENASERVVYTGRRCVLQTTTCWLTTWQRARHRRTGVYTKPGSLRRSVLPDEAWHIYVGRIGGSMHERGIIHATQARFPENLKTRLTMADIIRMPRPLQGSVTIFFGAGNGVRLRDCYFRTSTQTRYLLPVDLQCD